MTWFPFWDRSKTPTAPRIISKTRVQRAPSMPRKRRPCPWEPPYTERIVSKRNKKRWNAEESCSSGGNTINALRPPQRLKSRRSWDAPPTLLLFFFFLILHQLWVHAEKRYNHSFAARRSLVSFDEGRTERWGARLREPAGLSVQRKRRPTRSGLPLTALFPVFTRCSERVEDVRALIVSFPTTSWIFLSRQRRVFSLLHLVND